jgi:uncharacterized protein (TIGR03437 family)
MKKYLALFLLGSALAGAADFVTGQAARAIFGQQTFTAQDIQSPCQGTNTYNCQPPTPYVLGAVGGVAYANDTLFLTDSSRVSATPVLNRVLIYTGLSGTLKPPTESVNPPPGPNFVRCPLCIGTTDTALNTKTLGGGPKDPRDFVNYGISSTAFRTPTSVATDGNILVVADTDNNRVLIWKSVAAITQSDSPYGPPADIVLGQADFNTVKPVSVDAKSFRGPQGVWIQGTRLFVADTQNNRVMVWNNIPTSNNQAADYVLGVPSFTTPPQPDLTKNLAPATASNMLSPVSVTSDGTRLFVTDLGQNRVLIWNTIPTQNTQPADIAIGQQNLTTGVDNNAFTGSPATSSTDTTNKETPVMCTTPYGTDPANNPTYPLRCAATLSFPRFALSDGQRLFIADGGNDRILVFNTMPTQSGQSADVVLGQPDAISDVVSDSTDTFRPDANIGRSSANTIRTPISLAWDGTNLYATDPFDRRVMVFTPATPLVSQTGIVNYASRNVNAVGRVDITGTITAGDVLTISIGAPGIAACAAGTTATAAAPCATDYKYTVVKDDTIATIINAFVKLINAGTNGPDPNVLAIGNTAIDEIVLSARLIGGAGNGITLAVTTVGNGTTTTTTNAATEVLTTSGGTLSGGGSAGEIAPGTIVAINADAANGKTLADTEVKADPNASSLPTTLGGVEVYLDGMKAPIFYVSPAQIRVQMPFEVVDTTSVSAYVRIQHSDGSITVSNAVGVPIVGENPGIFALEGDEPRQVMAYHASSNAIAVVDLEGSAKAGDTATVTIDGRSYSYAVQATDTLLDNIRDGLIALINANADERVTAKAAGQFERIVLTAKVPGPDGNGIPITTNQSSTNTGGSLVTLTALQSQTCCASVAGSPITPDNPAAPGELITIYATGLGVVADPAKDSASTGAKYPLDAPQSTPISPVDNAQVGGKTANVLFAGLQPGMIGLYAVQMQLDPGLATNLQTQMYIAQDVFTSNIVTIPIVAPTPPQ